MRHALLPLLLLAPGAAAQDVELESVPTRWRITAERFDADSTNDVTLVGAHLDLLGVLPEYPEFYAGLGGYGAVEGDTGGLFVGGVTAGYLRELYRGFTLDLGFFAGGGGGGDADVGSGIMIRPHAAIEYAVGLVALRLEAARVEFPDGDIGDTHLALGLSLPGEILLARDGAPSTAIPEEHLRWRRVRLTPGFLWLNPESGTRKKTGVPLTDEIGMVGGELDYFVNDFVYLPVEAYGAVAGGVPGFAMVLGGLGISLPVLDPRIRIEAKVLGGAAGGGDVDTGGGFVYEAAGGLSARLSGNFSAQVLAGYFDAPDGDLESVVVSGGVSWNPRAAELGLRYPRSRLADEGLSSDDAVIDGVRVQALNKTYFPASSARTQTGSDYDASLQLVGIGLEKPVEVLDEAFALTGRVFTGYAGDIGGYAELLGGVKYEITPNKRKPEHVFTAHAEAGSGGGGGVDSASGVMYVFTTGYRYQWKPSVALSIEGGAFEADRGSFHGEVLQLGIQWNLNRAFKR